jgi:hypothetical protein
MGLLLSPKAAGHFLEDFEGEVLYEAMYLPNCCFCYVNDMVVILLL